MQSCFKLPACFGDLFDCLHAVTLQSKNSAAVSSALQAVMPQGLNSVATSISAEQRNTSYFSPSINPKVRDVRFLLRIFNPYEFIFY